MPITVNHDLLICICGGRVVLGDLPDAEPAGGPVAQNGRGKLLVGGAEEPSREDSSAHHAQQVASGREHAESGTGEVVVTDEVGTPDHGMGVGHRARLGDRLDAAHHVDRFLGQFDRHVLPRERLHPQHVGPERRHLVHQRPLAGGRDPGHHHHRGDADGDAERRQRGAQPAGAQAEEPQAQQIEKGEAYRLGLVLGTPGRVPQRGAGRLGGGGHDGLPVSAVSVTRRPSRR
ncbi:hypothetical protein RKD19_002187 [Streptomyces canus]